MSLAVFLLSGPPRAAVALETFQESPLVIRSQGTAHKFTVEMALSPRQRAQGLMWRRSLRPDRGMLFVYPSDRLIQMWMKNTLIPLDMLFIDKRGIILRIKERTVPRSLRAISSGRRARAVLEVSGGTASRLGLKVGDRVLHRVFGNR